MIGPDSTAMWRLGAAPAARPSAGPSGPTSPEPASDQGTADMDAQNVPEELVDQTVKVISQHVVYCDFGDSWRDCHTCRKTYEQVRTILAIALPAHEAMVLRAITVEQCGEMIAKLAEEAAEQQMTTRLAEFEAAIRTKVAEEARARAAAMKGISRIACHALNEFANILDEDLRGGQ